MRVVSWNVNKRVRGLGEQVTALARRGPDIVALQEVTTTTVGAFRRELARAGLVHAAFSLDLVGEAREDRRRCRGGVAVASRWPLQVLPETQAGVPWPERVLSVAVDRPSGAVEVHNAYLPNVSTGPQVGRPWLKVETFEGLFARLARASRHPRILCGDFNVPLSEETDGTIVPFGRPGRAAAAELSILRGLERFDLVDVYRLLHGYEAQEFSWFGQVRGYRLDHVLASRGLSAKACSYLHDLREQRLSDHAAIEVIFAPEASPPGG